MRFQKVVVAAVILVLMSVAGLAAFQMSDAARGEAAQQTIEREDSLAVEPDIRQKLTSDDDHDPTAYGDTITVSYNGSEWSEGTDYEYYNASGEIEFLRDEPGEADITYTYEVPRNQAADGQLQTVTEGYGNIVLLGVGLSFVALLLFIAGFTARKMGVGGRKRTGR